MSSGIAGARELVLPWPPAALSPNSRAHWTERRAAMESSKRLAWASAQVAKWVIPAGPRAHLWIDFYPPTRRLPDDDNMLARCKGYRDGIALALGVDDKVFVSHPYVRDTPVKGGEVRVRITGGPQ